MTADASLPPADERHQHSWSDWFEPSGAFDPGHRIRACQSCGDRELLGPGQQPADERQPPLGEEELAKLELGVSIGVLLRPDDSRRLIAALRASRAEVEELKAKLAWVDEQIDCGEL